MVPLVSSFSAKDMSSEVIMSSIDSPMAEWQKKVLYDLGFKPTDIALFKNYGEAQRVIKAYDQLPRRKKIGIRKTLSKFIP